MSKIIMLQIKPYPALEAMRHLNEVRGKFVQIVWKREPWLLMASKDQHAFHNQIVAHFLSELHIPFFWRSPERLEFDQSDFDILGGGKFQLNWSAKELSLSGESMVYGRFHEQKLADSLQHIDMPLKDFAITVE